MPCSRRGREPRISSAKTGTCVRSGSLILWPFSSTFSHSSRQYTPARKPVNRYFNVSSNASIDFDLSIQGGKYRSLGLWPQTLSLVGLWVPSEGGWEAEGGAKNTRWPCKWPPTLWRQTGVWRGVTDRACRACVGKEWSRGRVQLRKSKPRLVQCPSRTPHAGRSHSAVDRDTNGTRPPVDDVP